MNEVSILTNFPKQEVEDEVDHLKNDYPTLKNQPENLINEGIYLTSIEDGFVKLTRVAEPNTL